MHKELSINDAISKSIVLSLTDLVSASSERYTLQALTVCYSLDDFVNCLFSVSTEEGRSTVVAAAANLIETLELTQYSSIQKVELTEVAIALFEWISQSEVSNISIIHSPPVHYDVHDSRASMIPLLDILRDVPYIIGDYENHSVYKIPEYQNIVQWASGLLRVYVAMSKLTDNEQYVELPVLIQDAYSCIPTDIDLFGSLSLLMQKQYQLALVFNTFGANLPVVLDDQFRPVLVT